MNGHMTLSRTCPAAKPKSPSSPARGRNDRPCAAQGAAVCRQALPQMRQEGAVLGGREAGGGIVKN